MLRSLFVAAAAAVLLAVGALSAMAGNSHAKSEAVQSNANAAPASTQPQVQTQDQAETDESTDETATDEDTDETNDEATDEAAPAAPATAAPVVKTEQEGAEQDD